MSYFLGNSYKISVKLLYYAYSTGDPVKVFTACHTGRTRQALFTSFEKFFRAAIPLLFGCGNYYLIIN